MAAEELGIPDDKRAPDRRRHRARSATTTSTDGSRVTFATGMAAIKAARDAIKELCARAAKIWGIPEDAVELGERRGASRPAPTPASSRRCRSPRSRPSAGNTGGPIAGHYEVNADGAGAGFATHIVDVEVDPETGRTTVLRYTVVQDAGKAIHPTYVEGQMQGGAVQGIGWALNEEYIYDADGQLQNAGFLDYRMPVASRPADDRHGHRRGAEPRPSLRRARRRRDRRSCRRWRPWPMPCRRRSACA